MPHRKTLLNQSQEAGFIKQVKTHDHMNTMREANVLQIEMVSFCFLVHFFPSIKGEPRARCTLWILGHELFQFIVLWEISDVEVEDGPLL